MGKSGLLSGKCTGQRRERRIMKKNMKWWQKAVLYQIYPRSFCDSNGDGIGDIPGIISKLDYLEKLGIDGIWLSPVYQSPQDDNGYDISDYQAIDPMFGTMEDMEKLIREAKKRGIRIIMDLVLNHTSDEHRWFAEAKKGRDNPWHDYYVWRDGEEGVLPNDLKSAFGGPAWEWVPECGQYYLHQFSVKQPDLNWENPKVRKELYQMINWWRDKGVGGFRLDVIDLIGKQPDDKIMANGKMLHSYIKEMSREAFQGDCLVTVGETWSADVKDALLYSNPDGSELSMVFQFAHCILDQQPGKEKWDLAPLSLVELKKVFEKWQTGLYQKGWNSLFWDNHDLPRAVSRYGDDGMYRELSAKMLGTILHGMQGTPFIYQGEELGMTNVQFDISEYRDIETLNMYKERMEAGYSKEEIMQSIYRKSRDNARTPMQWSEGPYAGFSSVQPWIRCNPNYCMINASEQDVNQDSVFHYYRKLIRLRKEYDVFVDGKFELLLKEDPHVFAYTRENETEKMLVIGNFSGEEQKFTLPEDWADGCQLIGNYITQMQPGRLRAWETGMIVKKKEEIE